MSELDFQQFSSVQSAVQPQPTTLASAANITPTTQFTRITGTTSITTITKPTNGYHQITLVFSSAYAAAINTGGTPTATAGGIAVAYTSVVDRPITLHFDPRTNLYYPNAVV